MSEDAVIRAAEDDAEALRAYAAALAETDPGDLESIATLRRAFVGRGEEGAESERLPDETEASAPSPAVKGRRRRRSIWRILLLIWVVHLLLRALW